MNVDRRSFLVGAVTLATPRFAPAGLQERLAEILQGRQGAAIVLDAQSGKLHAEHRLTSIARRLVAPGSVIKPFVLAALLENRIVEPSTRRRCERALGIRGRKLDCTHPDVGGTLGPVEALAYSCNSYFAQCVSRIEPQALVQSLKSFGLASASQLTPSEVTGSIATPPDTGRLQLLALGEDGIRVTLPAVANAYRRLAMKNTNAAAALLTPVFEGLTSAVRYGTAQLAKPQSLTVAGKTGTSTEQTGMRAHAWFAGYSPAENPRFVVAVFLETGSGGGDAAPIARSIFSAL